MRKILIILKVRFSMSFFTSYFYGIIFIMLAYKLPLNYEVTESRWRIPFMKLIISLLMIFDTNDPSDTHKIGHWTSFRYGSQYIWSSNWILTLRSP